MNNQYQTNKNCRNTDRITRSFSRVKHVLSMFLNCILAIRFGTKSHSTRKNKQWQIIFEKSICKTLLLETLYCSSSRTFFFYPWRGWHQRKANLSLENLLEKEYLAKYGSALTKRVGRRYVTNCSLSELFWEELGDSVVVSNIIYNFIFVHLVMVLWSQQDLSDF